MQRLITWLVMAFLMPAMAFTSGCSTAVADPVALSDYRTGSNAAGPHKWTVYRVHDNKYFGEDTIYTETLDVDAAQAQYAQDHDPKNYEVTAIDYVPDQINIWAKPDNYNGPFNIEVTFTSPEQSGSVTSLLTVGELTLDTIHQLFAKTYPHGDLIDARYVPPTVPMLKPPATF